MDVVLPDNTKLKQTIRLLCTTGIRNPLNMERIKIWLKQFQGLEEQTLALLILRNLIYRTSSQIESSLRQALKEATVHFSPPSKSDLHTYDWRAVLTSKIPDKHFYFGPPAHEYSAPGKSGELITRLLHSSFGIAKSYLRYPSNSPLPDDEYFIMVDDGSFTGHQIEQIIQSEGQCMRNPRSAVVLSIAHEDAIKHLNDHFPEIKVFCGELLTQKDNFYELSKSWIERGLWPFEGTTPIDVYKEISTNRAKFQHGASVGYGGLGLLVAYEHGVPDNTLQLLWNRSDTWSPLFER